MLNLGGYDRNSFYDSNGVTYLNRLLQKEHNIKGIIQSDDKIPNLDGTIQVLEWDSNRKAVPKQIFHVQVKTLNHEYKNTNKIHNRSQYKYSVDTKVFNVVKEHMTFDPVLLFLVDEKNEKVFWVYVSIEYVMKLNLNNETTKSIYFDDTNMVSDLKVFHSQLVNIHEEKLRMNKDINENIITTDLNRNTEMYVMLQEEWNYLDSLLKNDLKVITDYMYPHAWKFGIAFQEGDEFNSIGIYQIRKGTNDVLLKEFSANKADCFAVSYYKKDRIDIRKILNEQVGYLVKKFFEKGRIPAKYLSDIVLEEIAFQFLDVISEAYAEVEDKEFILTYYKKEENVQEVRRLWNALILFAIKENEKLIEHYANQKDVIAEIDPLGKLLSCSVQNKGMAMRKFIECLQNTGKDVNELPYPLVYSQKYAYELYADVIRELEVRKIKRITRPWEPKKYNQMFEQYAKLQLEGLQRNETGYLIEDIYSNYGKMLKELPAAYKYTSKKFWREMAETRMIRMEYSICYDPSDVSCTYYKLIRNAFEFNIVINEYSTRELKELLEKGCGLERFNANCVSVGSFYKSCQLKFPLYNHIWYLLNLEMWKSCDIKKPILDLAYV